MITFKIFCWNCRGFSAPHTAAHIFKAIRTYKPSLVCLVETRANFERIDRFRIKLSPSWDLAAIESLGFSGGIFIFWNKSIGHVSPLAVSRRALHIVVSSPNHTNCIISVVYNSNFSRYQRFLWHELSKISQLHLPWLIIGDFNAVLSRQEFKGGNFSYYDRKARFFKDFVDLNNLIDFNFSGPQFTWCNNQLGPARRWARLDRCLVNLEWINVFRFYKLQHLCRAFSDHSPILLNISIHSYSRRKIFHFNNFWLDFIGCRDAVGSAWNFTPRGNSMHAFSHLLSRSRFFIRRWCRSGVNNIESNILQVESAIQDCESNIHNPISCSQLSDLYSKLEALHRQSNTRWAQRAHMSWLADGDKNSKFFHYINHSRTHFNLIHQVSNQDGVVVSNQSDILLAFKDFYAKLWSAPSDHDHNLTGLIPDDIPILSNVDNSLLIREVSKEEVYLTILDLPSGKASGPDGFNVEFYRAFWHIIGDSLFSAVKLFRFLFSPSFLG